jgi:hypothetical protein
LVTRDDITLTPRIRWRQCAGVCGLDGVGTLCACMLLDGEEERCETVTGANGAHHPKCHGRQLDLRRLAARQRGKEVSGRQQHESDRGPCGAFGRGAAAFNAGDDRDPRGRARGAECEEQRDEWGRVAVHGRPH